MTLRKNKIEFGSKQNGYHGADMWERVERGRTHLNKCVQSCTRVSMCMPVCLYVSMDSRQDDWQAVWEGGGGGGQ